MCVYRGCREGAREEEKEEEGERRERFEASEGLGLHGGYFGRCRSTAPFKHSFPGIPTTLSSPQAA